MANIYDINIGMNINSVNRSVTNVSNKRAITQMIANLIMTQTSEVPFKEWEGSRLMGLLGEACSSITASVIVEQIRALITKYVPYVELRDITYLIDPDNQNYRITLYYSMVNDLDVIEQTLNLSVTV